MSTSQHTTDDVHQWKFGLGGFERGRFSMPVESSQHEATLMAFPSIASADDTEHLQQMQDEIVSIANTIATFEPVYLYTRKELVAKAKTRVGANVIVKSATVDQLWVRDSGPVFVWDHSKNRRAAINFNFSYWGSKLSPTGDELLAGQIAEQWNVPLVTSPLTIEGGALEHDGEGTFLLAESCIINDNRNPETKRAEAEAVLNLLLGATSFIWVPGVKGYDITDYHIDALARFVEPGVVLLSKPSLNAPKIAIKAYEETRASLLDSKNARGQSLTIYDCKEPDTSKLGLQDKANQVVASYANYYLANGAVIVPEFGQAEQDNEALELFRRLFPSREVIQVSINMLPRTGGGIHCATQQVPQVR